MLICYFLIGMITGAVMDILRPAKYDNLSTTLKIVVPVLSGLLWPLVIGWFLYEIVKELVT